MKRILRILLCAMSVAIILSICAVYGAKNRVAPSPKYSTIVLYDVASNNWVPGTGGIDILDHGVLKDTYPGVRYDWATNTITLDNLDKPTYCLRMSAVGDIKVVIKGTVRLEYLVQDYLGASMYGSISISGSGKLITKGSVAGLRCDCKGARINIAKETRIDIKSKKTAIYIHERNRTKPDPDQVMNVSGDHSKGAFKVTEKKHKGNKPTYVYKWNKPAFTKDGKGSGAPEEPAKKARKPAQGVIEKTEVGYWGANSVAVWWKRLDNCKGYQVDYCTRKNFPKGKFFRMTHKDQNVIGSGAKKLPKGNIYIRVRGYNKVSGKTYYGKWSKVKKVKIN